MNDDRITVRFLLLLATASVLWMGAVLRNISPKDMADQPRALMVRRAPVLAPPMLLDGRLLTVATTNQIRLAWTPSTNSACVTNYILFQGVASKVYTNQTLVGNVTNAITYYLIGLTNYFAVVTVCSNNEYSDFSNEAVFLRTNSPPVTNVTLTVQGTTNLLAWYVMTNWTMMLTGRPTAEFYRLSIRKGP